MNSRQDPTYPDDLDPLEEPERWEALVGRIGERAAPHLADRRQPAGVLDLVTHWARPVLATAASLVLLAAAGAVTTGESRLTQPTPTEVTLAQALMPTTFAAWVAGVSEPTVTEMVRDLETLEEVQP